jgi:superfamily II DNA or RNA helicase
MAAIANDTTKQVLIFKQSAGTGFDAPRAFVLASTKPVNDADFAMQFIGRVMRGTAGSRRFPQTATHSR